jgi:hypothetical protein
MKTAQSAHRAVKVVVNVVKVVVNAVNEMSAANADKMALATTPPKLLTT